MERSPRRAIFRVPAIAKGGMVACGGVLLGWALFWLAGDWPALGAKLRGDAPDCPWMNVLHVYWDDRAYGQVARASETGLIVERRDPALGIDLVRSYARTFWIKKGEHDSWNGRQLLGHLLTEHGFLGDSNPYDMVRPGDIVIDCGAHVGVFTYFALKRGASEVVAVEPDPTNLECFRRNFGPEMASGRVVLVAKGVWSTAGTLSLRESTANSGSNTFVREARGRSIEVPVATIDALVSELRLPRVDYIKMDIEGAEREALAGAIRTLRKFRPRLMLDAYHLPDDPVVLPAIVRQAYGGYKEVCSPCDLSGTRLIPHALFFHPQAPSDGTAVARAGTAPAP